MCQSHWLWLLVWTVGRTSAFVAKRAAGVAASTDEKEKENLMQLGYHNG